MKLIIGLGNPGWHYRNSRHNVGIQVIKALAREHKIKLSTDKSALYKGGRGKINGADALLVYPLVFMNLSGKSASLLLKRYKIRLEDFLVVCDDLDLNLGNLRIRPSGSSGGHKGIKSIIEYLNTDSFPRLRLGIGRPNSKVAIKDFVLSKFKTQEADLFKDILHRAIQCSKIWLRYGIQEAMNQFNQRKREPRPAQPQRKEVK